MAWPRRLFRSRRQSGVEASPPPAPARTTVAATPLGGEWAGPVPTGGERAGPVVGSPLTVRPAPVMVTVGSPGMTGAMPLPVVSSAPAPGPGTLRVLLPGASGHSGLPLVTAGSAWSAGPRVLPVLPSVVDQDAAGVPGPAAAGRPVVPARSGRPTGPARPAPVHHGPADTEVHNGLAGAAVHHDWADTPVRDDAGQRVAFPEPDREPAGASGDHAVGSSFTARHDHDPAPAGDRQPARSAGPDGTDEAAARTAAQFAAAGLPTASVWPPPGFETVYLAAEATRAAEAARAAGGPGTSRQPIGRPAVGPDDQPTVAESTDTGAPPAGRMVRPVEVVSRTRPAPASRPRPVAEESLANPAQEVGRAGPPAAGHFDDPAEPESDDRTRPAGPTVVPAPPVVSTGASRTTVPAGARDRLAQASPGTVAPAAHPPDLAGSDANSTAPGGTGGRQAAGDRPVMSPGRYLTRRADPPAPTDAPPTVPPDLAVTMIDRPRLRPSDDAGAGPATDDLPPTMDQPAPGWPRPVLGADTPPPAGPWPGGTPLPAVPGDRGAAARPAHGRPAAGPDRAPVVPVRHRTDLPPSAHPVAGPATDPPTQVPATVVDGFRRRYGVDVSGVPVRRGPAATELVRQAGARAVTRGGEVLLPADAGPLDAPPARALLAHELAHVVQQHTLGGATPAEAAGAGRDLEARALAAEYAFGDGAAPDGVGPLAPPVPLVAGAPGASGRLPAGLDGFAPADGAAGAGRPEVPAGAADDGPERVDGAGGFDPAPAGGVWGVTPGGGLTWQATPAGQPPTGRPVQRAPVGGSADALADLRELVRAEVTRQEGGGQPEPAAPEADPSGALAALRAEVAAATAPPAVDRSTGRLAEVRGAVQQLRDELRVAADREEATVARLDRDATQLRSWVRDRVPARAVDLDSSDDLEELAGRLYGRLRGRLRQELLVDRERGGRLTRFT